MYSAKGPSREMIRRAVPNGPNVAVTAAGLEAADEDDDAIVVAVVDLLADATVRFFHPTSCNGPFFEVVVESTVGSYTGFTLIVALLVDYVDVTLFLLFSVAAVSIDVR